MILKAFEVRDAHTFIPVLAIKLVGDDSPRSAYLLRRCGYNINATAIILTRLMDGEGHCDPYQWTNGRTLSIVHQALRGDLSKDYARAVRYTFDALDNGAVIDVEYLLGETGRPKASEQLIMTSTLIEEFLGKKDAHA